MAMDAPVGVAHAPSPDVRVRPPGCRSLGAGCAPADQFACGESVPVPPLASYAGSQGMGNPSFAYRIVANKNRTGSLASSTPAGDCFKRSVTRG